MNKLIIALLFAFLAYALYYFIFRKKTNETKQGSGLSRETTETKTQSQLLKKEENNDVSDADVPHPIEDKTENAPVQSSLLKEDLAQQVAETRSKDKPVFDEVKHVMQDSAGDMLIHPELLDEDLAQKAAAVKEETDALIDKTEDKITLTFGNPLKENKIEVSTDDDKVEDQTEEATEDITADSGLLREDLAQEILEDREEPFKSESEDAKSTLLDLNPTMEADIDNKTIDVLQHFENAQEQANLLKDDIDEIPKQKIIVKKFVRKEQE